MRAEGFLINNGLEEVAIEGNSGLGNLVSESFCHFYLFLFEFLMVLKRILISSATFDLCHWISIDFSEMILVMMIVKV